MKRIFLPCVAVLLLNLPVVSQVKSKTTTAKPPVVTKAKPVSAAKPVMKNMLDSASYAIGIFTVNSFRQYGITNMNSALVARAIEDMLANKKILLSDSAANASISNYISKLQSEKSKPNIAAGEKYLAENKKRQGVQVTPSGLQYEIITAGTGSIPKPGDSVTCNYKGMFIDGTVFEDSYKSGKPVTFAVTGVIPGWTEALLMMTVGSKWKLYVPYQKAYGINDYFAIPGGSALIFELELLGIKGK